MTVLDASVHTTDLTAAEKMLREVYPVAQFRETGSPFSYGQHVVGDERAVLATFSLATWAEVQVDFSDIIGIGHVVSGRYEASIGERSLDTDAPFLFGLGTARAQSEQLTLHMVNLDAPSLVRYAAGLRGLRHPRLGGVHAAPVSAEAGRMWTRTVQYVRDAFDDPLMLGNDIVRQGAIDLLFATALTAFDLEVAGTPESARDDALPATVRRAVAYIDEHRAEPIGLEEIAAAARLSVRGLQSAFRRHLDQTPLMVLRQARLAAAREELLLADPSTATVAGIARTWGFGHLGRFADHYRAAFGELPKRTLER